MLTSEVRQKGLTTIYLQQVQGHNLSERQRDPLVKGFAQSEEVQNLILTPL